jgi:hypothetical protein
MQPIASAHVQGTIDGLSRKVPNPLSPVSSRTLFHVKKAIVERVTRETQDTRTILLRPDGGFSFKPGQFAMVTAPDAGEAPFAPSSSAVKTDTVQFTVKRAGRVTSAIHVLKPGDAVGIRGPYGKPFSPERRDDPEIAFFCRGIGMATVIPFLHAVPDGKENHAKIALWADPSGAFPKAGENSDFTRSIGMMRMDESPGIGSAMKLAGSLKQSGFHPDRASVLLFCGQEENANLSGALLRCGFRPECIFLWTERKMACAIGQCRHCTIEHLTLCREGPLLPLSGLRNLRG